jgi:uncharacterized damage-inducible protein DinB
MTDWDPKEELHLYLRDAREALLWKLDGVSEYDARRPLTPTGTNLLGIVKHVASVAAEYLGDVFGRPFPEPLPWMADEAEDNADMWATAAETRADILGLHERAWAHADATIEALPLEATGQVPWWPEERRTVTLHRVMAHLTAETNRHAGHADIVRELVDGSVGYRPHNANLPPGRDDAWWSDYRARLERSAVDAARG